MVWNIIGHQTAIAFLKEHTKVGKTRHAYLITGPDGVGKRTLALAFVKALNCQNPPADGEFCGECTSCRQIDNEQYSDLAVVQPEKGRDLRIEQIRALQQSLALAPYQSRYRTVLLMDFQKATASASNALLKSLEEPPQRAMLILTADAAENVLPTISSRCEVIRLKPSSVNDAVEGLKAHFSLEPKEAIRLAHRSSGRIGTALSFARDEKADMLYTANLEKLLELLPLSKRGRLAWAETAAKQKTTLRDVLAYLLPVWLNFWRDCLIVKAEAELPLVNLEWHDQITQTAGLVAISDLQRLLAMHEKALDQLESYVNARLILEYLLINLPRVAI